MNPNKKIKSAGRFFFVSMPLKIFGWNQLKAGNSIIKSLWSDFHDPICSRCETGTISYVSRKGADESLDNNERNIHIYSCSKCGYTINCTKDELKQHIISDRNEKYKSYSSDSRNQKQLSKTVRNHIFTSRCVYVISLCFLFYSCYLIGSGKPWLMVINYLSITATTCIYAMKRSYRAWQILTNHLFIPNSFIKWLMNGRWVQ